MVRLAKFVFEEKNMLLDRCKQARKRKEKTNCVEFLGNGRSLISTATYTAKKVTGLN